MTLPMTAVRMEPEKLPMVNDAAISHDSQPVSSRMGSNQTLSTGP